MFAVIMCDCIFHNVIKKKRKKAVTGLWGEKPIWASFFLGIFLTLEKKMSKYHTVVTIYVEFWTLIYECEKH